MGFLEGLGGALYAAGGTALSAALSAKEAKKQRRWQERMSNTAHQREAKDLEAAGLNRILSVSRGAGASTPSGAMGKVPDIGSSMSSGASSALAAKGQKTLLEAQKAQIIAQTQTTEDQGWAAMEQAMKTGTEKDLLQQLLPAARLQKEFDQSTPGRAATIGDRSARSVGSTVGTAGGLSIELIKWLTQNAANSAQDAAGLSESDLRELKYKQQLEKRRGKK